MDITAIANYLDKLEKVVNREADFSIGNYKLIKKAKIDDVLCCLLASFPDVYKKAINRTRGNKYRSILSYHLLFNAIKGKFILNNSVYLVNSENIQEYINTMKHTIESDVEKLMKLENM